MAKLIFNEKPIELEAGSTLFDHADRLALKIPSSCGRHGSCHECIIEVTAGQQALSPRTEHEQFLRGNYRLSCQCRVERNDVEIHAHALRRGNPQIASGGKILECYGTDPCVTRGEGDAVLLDGEPIAQSTGPIYGLAADVGTTTVVLRLVDLETGCIKAAHSFENPQMFGGTDVMGRITYDRDNRRRDLQQVLMAYINRSIDEFCETLGCENNDIYEFVVAGNATMRDIFFGLDVRTIGERPYQSLTEREMHEGKRENTVLVGRPGRLRLRMNRKGRVYGVPLIACHVGADTAACLAAIQIDQEERLVMLMDIGTNTEVVIGNKDRILCASCPAGPAFEGGAIARGMPGLDGAIEQIRIENGGSVHYKVIGDIVPLGICGSGMVDALGEMLRTSRMNELGRIESNDGRFWIDHEHDIFVMDNDVSELAQAKSANIAGLMILLEQYGVTLDQVDRFYLAGGFANYIDAEHAIRIGLIPDMPLEKIEKIGNASVEGATMLLCSARMRGRIERLVRRIGHVELEQHPNFFGFFVEGCQFKPSSQMMIDTLSI